jgi:hypothetical protein
MLCHTRRDDEVEITYCDRMTVPCADVTDTAPIALPGSRDVAVYADIPNPEGSTCCQACYAAYLAQH